MCGSSKTTRFQERAFRQRKTFASSIEFLIRHKLITERSGCYESRQRRVSLPGLRARVMFNKLAGWIGMRSSERDKPSTARDGKRPHAGRDVGLTCEGVQARRVSGESDRHARGDDIRQEKTVAG